MKCLNLFRDIRSQCGHRDDLPSIKLSREKKKLSSFLPLSTPKRIIAENERELKVKKAEKEFFKPKRNIKNKS